eukprot:RCo049638
MAWYTASSEVGSLAPAPYGGRCDCTGAPPEYPGFRDFVERFKAGIVANRTDVDGSLCGTVLRLRPEEISFGWCLRMNSAETKHVFLKDIWEIRIGKQAEVFRYLRQTTGHAIPSSLCLSVSAYPGVSLHVIMSS